MTDSALPGHAELHREVHLGEVPEPPSDWATPHSPATWRRLLALAAKGDRVIACTLTEAELDVEFNDGFGGNEGAPFTAWSEQWVYFPTDYDGAEDVARTRRDPCGYVTEHV